MLDRHTLAPLLTGMASTLAGIGVARFAYTPLLPALVQQEWFSAGQAAYLGAANLLGYLIGALLGHPLSERFSSRLVLGGAFLAIALSFVLCAGPAGFAWFFVWRLISGVAGAVLMVVGPSLALAATPAARRTTVGALSFTGIGLGALLSATLVPLFLTYSLSATWLALGVLSLLAWLAGDRGLAGLATERATGSGPDATTSGALSLAVPLVIAAYALDATGFVPHTVFWVDYLARERALGAGVGSLQWALFGLGAVAGPLLAGAVARRLGWHAGLSLAFLIKTAAVALPLLSVAFMARSVSSFLVGALIPGVVALTSGRLAELVGPRAHKRLWGLATAAFAAAQAATGYAMSGLYGALGSYYPLFVLGSAALAAGFVLVLLSRALQERCIGFALPPWRR